MAYPPPKELLEYLRFYDESIHKLMLATRAFVLEEMVPCVESIVDAYSAVAAGYGPTERIKDGVCYIAACTNYVNLGFHHGVELDDPSGLLQGTGHYGRHISIRTISDLKNPAVRKCLRAAYKMAAMKETTRNLKGLTTIVKKPYPRKRRPLPIPRTAHPAGSLR